MGMLIFVAWVQLVFWLGVWVGRRYERLSGELALLRRISPALSMGDQVHRLKLLLDCCRTRPFTRAEQEELHKQIEQILSAGGDGIPTAEERKSAEEERP